MKTGIGLLSAFTIAGCAHAADIPEGDPLVVTLSLRERAANALGYEYRRLHHSDDYLLARKKNEIGDRLQHDLPLLVEREGQQTVAYDFKDVAFSCRMEIPVFVTARGGDYDRAHLIGDTGQIRLDCK